MSQSEVIDLDMSDLGSSVVVISDDEVTPESSPSKFTYESSPLKVTPASKRKRDILVEIEAQERNEILGLKNNASAELIDMERLSPEPRRKNPSGLTPNKSPKPPGDLHEKQSSVPDVVGDLDLDENLPETVILLRTPDGGKVYVVGTAHFSDESQADVSKIIRAVHPHTVVLELCKARTDMLINDEEAVLAAAKDINFQKMLMIARKDGIVQGLLYITLLTMSAHVTRELGMAPGGEFRRAYQEVSKIPGCMLLLGDRAIDVSIARALSGLSWWQCIKLLCNVIFSKDPIKKGDVEKCKQRDFIESMLEELAGEFPGLKEVLVTERDKYLTYSLQNAASIVYRGLENQPCRVVGVVGIGHMPGIQKYWGKITEEEVLELTVIPPQSLSSKIVRLTIRSALIGGVVYGIYKFVPIPYNRVMQFIRP